MGLVQRELEQAGFVTVGISLVKEISERIKPPRTLLLRYPFGHPFGEPFHTEQHLRIVKDCFNCIEIAQEAPTLIESPYRWKRTKF